MAPSPKFPRLLSPAEAEVIAEAEAITVEAAYGAVKQRRLAGVLQTLDEAGYTEHAHRLLEAQLAPDAAAAGLALLAAIRGQFGFTGAFTSSSVAEIMHYLAVVVEGLADPELADEIAELRALELATPS